MKVAHGFLFDSNQSRNEELDSDSRDRFADGQRRRRKRASSGAPWLTTEGIAVKTAYGHEDISAAIPHLPAFRPICAALPTMYVRNSGRFGSKPALDPEIPTPSTGAT